MKIAVVAALILSLEAGHLMGEAWKSGSPRKEIEPTFSADAKGGKSGKGAWSIEGDGREGLYGYWFKGFPVKGGQYYRFSAYRRTFGMDLPRRSSYARLIWDDGKGELVERPSGRRVHQDPPIVEIFFPGGPQPGDRFIAEPEFPQDGAEEQGWTRVSGVYRAPSEAARIIVELNFQWAPKGRVEWSDVELEPCPPPAERKARLATANIEPRDGASPLENCQKAVPLIEEAARQRADLLVFSEHFTTQGLNPSYSRQPAIDSAEAIPGGLLSEFFCRQAKKHDMYLVVGMYERAGNCVYNDAVLFGPEGVVGKYRKINLTSGEIAMGLTPGSDCPVFQTRFGKVGMMVCYDTQNPEVARKLAAQGAEVIAVPAYGFTTLLGLGRAVENQVYLVSSIYIDDGQSPPNDRWGVSAVINPQGKIIARAPKKNSIAVAEVNLTPPTLWPWLGNWRESIPRLLRQGIEE